MKSEVEIRMEAAEYRRLRRLEAAALDLSRLFVPKINIAASAIPAEGFAAFNEFEMAVSEIRRADEQ